MTEANEWWDKVKGDYLRDYVKGDWGPPVGQDSTTSEQPLQEPLDVRHSEDFFGPLYRNIPTQYTLSLNIKDMTHDSRQVALWITDMLMLSLNDHINEDNEGSHQMWLSTTPRTRSCRFRMQVDFYFIWMMLL